MPDSENASSQAPSVDDRLSDSVQWFAVWTRSRHEQVVREQLEKKKITAFLPTIPRWSRWKDRKKKIDFPLFPGYCFAQFDPAHALRDSYSVMARKYLKAKQPTKAPPTRVVVPKT